MNSPRSRGATGATAPRRGGSLSTLRTGSHRGSGSSVVALSPGRGRRAGSTASHSNHRGSGRAANGRHGPSLGLTIGGIGDHLAGYITLGNRSSNHGLSGALYYNGNHRGNRRGYGYGYGHGYGRGSYYGHYRPISYYGYNYYEPLYGYTYLSAYYPNPYAYRFQYTDVYYVDSVVEHHEIPATPAATAVDVTPASPAPAATYQALTEPGDDTLIGQGNAAFMAGRYDEARRSYVSAMLADERDGYAKFLYALANFAMRDYEVAGMALHRALLTTPALLEYPVDVRSLYEPPILFETQLTDLNRFVNSHAKHRGALLLLGYLHYASGQAERALAIVTGLSESDTNDSVAAVLRDAIVRVGRAKQLPE